MSLFRKRDAIGAATAAPPQRQAVPAGPTRRQQLPSGGGGAPGNPPASAQGQRPGSTPNGLPAMRHEPVGAVLVDMGLLTPEELAAAIARQQTDGRELGDLLVTEGRITRDQFCRAMAQRIGVSFYTLSDGVDPACARLMDEKTARRYSAVPVKRDPDGHLVVAMADPSNVFAIDDLRILTRHEIRPALAMLDDIATLISSTARLEEVVADLVDRAEGDGSEDTAPADISEGADDAPVVKLVNSVISRAVDERASDVHFEPQAGEMVVRYRIDGVLRRVTSVPQRLSSGVTSRIKIMSDLDISERRLPQDGRVSLNVGGRQLDVRVATLPTVYGEKVVLRILDKTNVLLQLSDLGFTPDVLARFERCYRRPYGAVLVTGPTGSGKSTTLYGTLNQLNAPEKNVITVEDPVEYRLPGINQVQANVKAGLTFAAGLRSVLRCDPDIVMIGEVRDKETAQIAVESALTGHLVLATLHTNDSAAALTRLTEMGVEPFLSASAVTGILAQRLSRRLCPHCRVPDKVRHAVLTELAETRALPPSIPDPAPVFRAGGCARCSGSGYRGRTGVFEMLVISEPIEKLLIGGGSADDIRRQARREGMRTLREDGILKVLAGQTTIEELARAVG